LSRAGWGLLALLVSAAACSRHEAAGSGGGPSASVSLTAPPASPTAAEPSPSALRPATSEDADESAAQRITEQNLETELDRLEREIQAE